LTIFEGREGFTMAILEGAGTRALSENFYIILDIRRPLLQTMTCKKFFVLLHN